MADATSTLKFNVDTTQPLRSLKKLQDEFNALKSLVSGGLGSVNLGTNSGLAGLSSALQSLNAQMSSLSVVVGQANVQLNQLNATTSQNVQATNNAAQAANNAAGAARKHTQSLQDLHSAARGVAGGFQAMWLTWGNIVPLLSGFSIATVVRQSVTAFADMQYQMTFVRDVAGGTSDSIEMLSDKMRTMNKDLGITGTEGAKGLRALAQAGLSVNEAFQALPAAFRLATIGETDLATASTTLTGIMNSFGMVAPQMGYIGDVIAKSAAMSATSVEKMAESMKIAAPTAHQFKISLEETAVALTALAKSNITGSAGGTSLKNMIKELGAPKGAQADLLKQLGFSAYDLSGQSIKPLMQQIKELAKSIEPFTRQSQGVILTKLFGERGDKAFYSLLLMSQEELKKITDGIENSTGFTTRAFADLQLTVSGQFKMLKADWDALMSSVGDASGGALVNMMRDIRAAINDPGTASGLRMLINMVTQIGSVSIQAAPYVLAFLAGWKTVTTITGLVTNMTAAVAAAAGATTTLGTVVTGFFGPLGKLIALLGAAVTGLVMYKNATADANAGTSKMADGLVAINESLEKELTRQKIQLEQLKKGRNDASELATALSEDTAKNELEKIRATNNRLQQDKDNLASQLTTEQRQAAERYGKEDANVLQTARESLADLSDALKKKYPGMMLGNQQLTAFYNYAKVVRQSAESTEALNKAEQQYQNVIKNGQALREGNKNIKSEQERIDAEEAAKLKERLKAGTKVYDEHGNQKIDAQAGRARTDILDEFRFAEQMARQEHDMTVKLAQDELSKKLISVQEYYTKVSAADAAYNQKFTAAKETVNAKLDAIPLSMAADRRATAEQFENDKMHIERLEQQRVAQNKLNESQRVFIEQNKLLKDSNDFRIQLNKDTDTDARANAKALEHEKNKFLQEDQRTIADLEDKAFEKAQKNVDAAQQQLDIYTKLRDAAQEMVAAGPRDGSAEGQAEYEGAKQALTVYEKIVGAKKTDLTLSKMAQDNAVKGASQLGQQINKLQEWPRALQKATEWAGKMESTFGRIGKAIGGLVVGFTKYRTEIEAAEKGFEASKKGPEDHLRMQEQMSIATIGMYGDMASAAKNFFNEGTTGYKALEIAEKTFRAFELAEQFYVTAKKLGLISAETAAVIEGHVANAAGATTAGLTNVEMAEVATAAWMKMALVAGGIFAGLAILGSVFGSKGGYDSALTAEKMQQNQGLDRYGEKNKTIESSLEAIKTNTSADNVLTNHMIEKLQEIRDGIKDLGANVAGVPGVTSGGTNSSNKVLFGLFSSSKQVLDSGLTGDFRDLQKMMSDQFMDNLKIYQTIHEESSSFFGLFSSSSTYQNFQDADFRLKSQLGKIFAGLGEVMTTAGKSLGVSAGEMAYVLSNMSVSLNLSLKGLSAKEASEQIEAVIGSISDQLAEQTFSWLQRFQRSGEGMFNTLIRMASAVEDARNRLSYLNVSLVDLNNGMIDIHAEDMSGELTRVSLWYEAARRGYYELGDAVKQAGGDAATSIKNFKDLIKVQQLLNFMGGNFQGFMARGAVNPAAIRGAGGIDQYTAGANAFEQNFLSQSEKTQLAGARLVDELQAMNLTLPQTRDQWKALVQANVNGGYEFSYAAGKLIALSDAASEYYDLLEKKQEEATNNEALDKQRQAVDKAKANAERWNDVINGTADVLNQVFKIMNPDYFNTNYYDELKNRLGSAQLSPEQQIDTAKDLLQLVTDRYNAEKEGAQKMIDFAKELTGYVDSLKLGENSPMTNVQKLGVAKNDFQTLLSKAQAGDTDAQSQLQSAADAYLKQARTVYSSSDAYTGIFDTVTSQLSGLSATMNAQGTSKLQTAQQQQTADLAKIRDVMMANNVNAGLQLAAANSELTYQLNQLNILEQQLGVESDIRSILDSLPARIGYFVQPNGYSAAFYAFPSHALGLDYVPFDNYTARLHKGERILTASQTAMQDALSVNVSQMVTLLQALCQEVNQQTTVLSRVNFEAAESIGEVMGEVFEEVASVGQVYERMAPIMR